MIKKIIVILVILILIGGVILFLDSQFGTDQKEKPIKIGVIASLTEKGADRGEGALKALELAKERIEKEEILDRNLELIVQDVPFNNSARGPIAFQALVDSGVVAVIGPMGSSVALSIVPIVDQSEVPTIVHTASALEITKNNEYVFRLWTTAENYSSVIDEEIKKLHYDEIGVITSISNNTVDLFNIMKEKSKENGSYNFNTDERVTVDANDIRTQLLKTSVSNPDAIFLNLYEGQFLVALKQMDELGIKIPVFANSVFTEIEIDSDSGNADGVWFPRFSGWNEQVKQSYIEKYGKEPKVSESAAAAYDALLVLADAFAAVGTDSEAVKDYLYENTFHGSSGKIRFLPNGDAEVAVVLKEVRGGEIIDRK